MPRHFLDLEGAATVATEPLRLTHRAVADLRRAHAMGVVHGDAGLGKTFAVEDAMLTSTQMAEACWTSVGSRLTLRQLTLDLLGLLTRRQFDTTRHKATYELIEILAERPRLLILDESQRLSSDGIELLRHLHDHPATQFALLLVGGNGCWEVLSREPMLRSRIYRRIHFQPLSPQQVLEVLPGYHPLYAQTDPDLLSLVDESYAHGNWRAWASFTRTALELATQTGRVRLLRQLHDPELAALGAAALLLGRPDPADQAAARVYVTEDAHSIATADERVLQVPEYARGLLRGWSRRELLPPAWALDVAETYLVLRLEEAGRYVGLPLLDPASPQLPPTAWHERADPGAALLAWLTRSRWIR
jgi:hypothetical protein